MTTTWAIHPELVLEVHAKKRAYDRYFRNEYERVAVDPGKNPVRVVARVVRALPAPERGDIRRALTFKRIFKYDYIIRGLDTDEPTVYFRDVWSAALYPKVVTLFLQAQILEPIIYLKLLERGVLFMHAAGVSDGKHGYLLPAYGGTGKTTLTLGLMGEGMAVLGDDLLLVDPASGHVRPYLRPLHVFTYNVKTLRGAKLPLRVRALVRFKDVLRIVLETLTRQEFLISTRVHADRIYPDFNAGTRVPYRKIAFLVKEGDDFALSTKRDHEELIDRIIASADLNDSLFDNILEGAPADRARALERSVIGSVIATVDKVHFVNTRKLDFRDLSAFRAWLIS